MPLTPGNIFSFFETGPYFVDSAGLELMASVSICFLTVLDTLGSLTGVGVKPEANLSGISLGLDLQLAEPVALDPQPQTNFASFVWAMKASSQGLQLGLWHPEVHLPRCHAGLDQYPLPWHC